jgi:hypothetical protein
LKKSSAEAGLFSFTAFLYNHSIPIYNGKSRALKRAITGTI